MYRKKYQDLLKWKNSNTRKPLILMGARQVGKTWLMKEFGRNEYSSVAYINCDNNNIAKHIFEQDYDIRRLLLAFQSISGIKIEPHKTLVIIDEIQEAPRALSALKYFCENAREYHIMAAGSLLGVTLQRNESFPVGKVNLLHVYPMDFEEYLLAMDEAALCEIIRSRDLAMIKVFSPKLKDLLFQYYYVGGMPEVVKTFKDTQDLSEVRSLQTTILDSYRMDISKHTTKTESVRIGQVLASLPSQLTKENSKFIYGVAKPGGRAADFEMAIMWLIDAGLIYKVTRVSKIAIPLKFYEDMQAFKLMLLDVGLLCCMADVPPILILQKADMVEFSGMLTEEYVAQQLISNGVLPYYWSNSNTKAEIDFVITVANTPIPIEVKANTNVKAKSLMGYLNESAEHEAWRFSQLDYNRQGQITDIPLYMAPFISYDSVDGL